MKPTKPPKVPKVKPPKPENYPAFIAACLELGIQMPICAANGGELLFAREFGRIWRTDYLFINDVLGVKLAVEIEGGTWDNGAHNRGSGYLKNVQKYNAYSLLGYTLLRFTAIQAKTEPISCAKWVKCVLKGTIDASLMEISEAEKLEGERIRAKRKNKALKQPIKKPLAVIDFPEIAKAKKQSTTKGMSKQSKLWLDIQDKNKGI
jgi:hypothetical protein